MLVKFKPFGTTRHNSELSSWVNDFFNYNWNNSFEASPSVNVREDENGFTLEVAAPGLAKEDFSISLDKNLLTISAERKTDNKEGTDAEKFLRREFNFTRFNRTFNLNNKVNAEHIDAKYENGVLLVSLPKKEEAKEKPARQIEIA